MKKIKTRVENILEKYPKTRDDDRVLYTTYIAIHCPELIIEGNFGVKAISLLNLTKVPSFESIRRCRQKIQESGLFPCTPEASQKRFRHTEKIRVELLEKKNSLFYAQ